MSRRKLYDLIRLLKIPTVPDASPISIDTEVQHPFQLSVKLFVRLNNPKLKPIYTFRDLSTLYRNPKTQAPRDHKTIKALLKKHNVPLYGKHKKYVYLWHLCQFSDEIAENKPI